VVWKSGDFMKDVALLYINGLRSVEISTDQVGSLVQDTETEPNKGTSLYLEVIFDLLSKK